MRKEQRADNVETAAYDGDLSRQVASDHQYTPHIRSRGEEKHEKLPSLAKVLTHTFKLRLAPLPMKHSSYTIGIPVPPVS